MRYPLPPDASSPEPYGFWWNYAVPDGALDVCATDGAAFLRTARAAVGLAQTPVWDAALSQGLIRTAAEFDAATPGAGWGAVRAALQAEAASPGPVSTTFALYVAFYRTYGRYDAIRVSSATVWPRLNQTVAAPADSGLYACWVPGEDVPPAGSDVTVAVLNETLEQSRFGWRVHPGDSIPSPVDHPRAQPSTGASATVALVALTGLVVIAIGAAVLNHRAAAQYAPRKRGRR